MKKRLDFVTNSSSSSYICEVCELNESGYDMGLDEANMYECTRGHIFCKEHVVKECTEAEFGRLLVEEMTEEDIKYILKAENLSSREEILCDDDLLEEIWNDAYNIVPKSVCPLCQLKAISIHNLSSYTMAKLGTTEEILQEEISKNFLTYEDFMNYINKERK